MAMTLSLVITYHFMHKARVCFVAQNCTNDYGQHLLSVSTQHVFVKSLSTLSSGKGPQLNSTRWVYRYTQELRSQADLQWLHHFLHKACPFYMEGSQEFTVASAQLYLHLCLSVNLRLPEQLEFIWETNLPFSFNVMPHLLTFFFKKCIRQDAM